MRKVSRKRAEDAVGSQHRSLLPSAEFREDYPNHFHQWEGALVNGVPQDLIRQDFGKGAGNELQGNHPKPPKFCAAHSSSALCANSFGPARQNPSWLRFGGHSGFSDFRFERKLPTGLRGESPNLDFVATTERSILAVESKFLETLNPKKPEFVESYEKAFAECGCSVLEAAYLSVREPGSAFFHLDAAQLMKHALGVMHYSSLDRPVENRTLGYVFWEPENHTELEPYVSHRQELRAFEQCIEGSKIRFLAMSYRELWESWWQVLGEADRTESLIHRYKLEL